MTDVAVSVGPQWRQQFTCSTIDVLKYSLSLVTVHTKSATCRGVGAFLLCFTASSYVSGFVGKGKGECRYVTTHNSTARCRANHKVSLFTQIIRLTCRWVAHSNCDIILQVSHDKSRRLQCGPTLTVRYPPTS
ncbi:hypothetical protein PoB_003500400 [Plakobranchus ocellatus]|uniref:Uncharacterized protein n=1 Tax=Plakobranchus ocellatus TaxID=259542 RepID=A0AAV4AQA4_9GAST|nr:hypothetical protein PoB_003500400 [Plakobranchus ocellatus]